MGQQQNKLGSKEAVRAAINKTETKNNSGTKTSGGSFKSGYKK